MGSHVDDPPSPHSAYAPLARRAYMPSIAAVDRWVTSALDSEIVPISGQIGVPVTR